MYPPRTAAIAPLAPTVGAVESGDTATLIAMIRIVMTGSRSVGMLSLSGIKGRGQAYRGKFGGLPELPIDVAYAHGRSLPRHRRHRRPWPSHEPGRGGHACAGRSP